MELTGKCREHFEKWMEFNHLTRNTQFFNSGLTPDSFRWGVLQDFFDRSEIDTDYLFENEIYIQLSKNEGKGSVGDFREIARKYAIDRANELYNNAK